MWIAGIAFVLFLLTGVLLVMRIAPSRYFDVQQIDILEVSTRSTEVLQVRYQVPIGPTLENGGIDTFVTSDEITLSFVQRVRNWPSSPAMSPLVHDAEGFPTCEIHLQDTTQYVFISDGRTRRLIWSRGKDAIHE